MNKYQKVIAQLTKDDKKKGHNESFREMRNAYRSVLKHHSYERLVGFKHFNKALPV